MRNSNSSLKRQSDKDDESDYALPQEWDYLSKRLAEVQKGLTIVQKKQSKLESRFNKNIHQLSQYNTELTDEFLNLKSNMVTRNQFKDEIFRQIQNVELQIKNFCKDSIAAKIQSINMPFYDKFDSIQLKIKSVYDQTKAYVDRAMHQLKQLLKKYVKEQGQLQKKIQRSSRENSPNLIPRNSVTSLSSLNKSKSSKRLFQNNQKTEHSTEKIENNINNWSQKNRQNGSQGKQAQLGTNRVSYLRQKLKQFEKINKKYEGQSQKVNKKQQKQQIVKKMRNYRQYLQQSQSELQPSNFLTSEEATGFSIQKKNAGLF